MRIELDIETPVKIQEQEVSLFIFSAKNSLFIDKVEIRVNSRNVMDKAELIDMNKQIVIKRINRFEIKNIMNYVLSMLSESITFLNVQIIYDTIKEFMRNNTDKPVNIK